MALSKFHFLDDNCYLVIITKKIVMVTGKKVKATNNDGYFNRYGCSLYRNKARLSVSHVFVSVTKSFLACIFIRISVVIFLLRCPY